MPHCILCESSTLNAWIIVFWCRISWRWWQITFHRVTVYNFVRSLANFSNHSVSFVKFLRPLHFRNRVKFRFSKKATKTLTKSLCCLFSLNWETSNCSIEKRWYLKSSQKLVKSFKLFFINKLFTTLFTRIFLSKIRIDDALRPV